MLWKKVRLPCQILLLWREFSKRKGGWGILTQCGRQLGADGVDNVVRVVVDFDGQVLRLHRLRTQKQTCQHIVQRVQYYMETSSSAGKTDLLYGLGEAEHGIGELPELVEVSGRYHDRLRRCLLYQFLPFSLQIIARRRGQGGSRKRTSCGNDAENTILKLHQTARLSVPVNR